MISSDIDSPQRPFANFTGLTNCFFYERSLFAFEDHRRLGECPAIITPSCSIGGERGRAVRVMKSVNESLRSVQPCSVTTECYQVTERRVIIAELVGSGHRRKVARIGIHPLKDLATRSVTSL